MTSGQVRPKALLAKEDVSQALAADWFRAAHGRKGAFADAIGAKCTKTVDRVITGEHLPALHTALNSLLSDPSALFNTLRLAGGCFVPVSSAAGNDMATVCAMLHTVSEYAERIKDGERCHRDTLALAELLIPLIPALLAITDEAQRIRRGV